MTSYAGFWIDPSDLTVRRTPQHGGLPGDADQGTPSRSAEDLLPAIRRSVAAPPEYHAAWAVVLKDTDKSIGFVNYHHREISSARLEIGYILARACWGRGFAAEMVSVLLDHCFDVLDVNRVEALIDPDNHASIRLAERMGFQRESGRMRQRLKMPDGRFADILMFGLLAEDWWARRRLKPVTIEPSDTR